MVIESKDMRGAQPVLQAIESYKTRLLKTPGVQEDPWGLRA